MRQILALAGAVSLLFGCTGGSYYKSYLAENPGTYVTLPDEQSDLHQTLAGLYAPAGFDYRLMISKLSVLRVTADSSVELSSEEITQALGEPPSKGTHYGIVATVRCTSKIDVHMYTGEKVEWLLLEDGRLSAWNLSTFVSRCVVANEFRPASANSAALEDQVRGYRDRKFPRSTTHTSVHYRQGLAYLKVDRLEAAEAMLALGDRGFDVSGARGTRFERPSDAVETVNESDIARARKELASGIEWRRARDGGGS